MYAVVYCMYHNVTKHHNDFITLWRTSAIEVTAFKSTSRLKGIIEKDSVIDVMYAVVKILHVT